MKQISELMNLSGRVALITGGAGHIGSAMAGALGELGAKLVIADLVTAKSQESVDNLARSLGGPVDVIDADLLEGEASKVLVQETLARHGRLDVLVHCAAFTGDTKCSGWAVPFRQQTVEAWDKAMRVNLTAAFALAQEAAPALAASGSGSIVFVSSIYGMVGPDFRLYDGTGMENPAAYNASKAGLLQLVRYLATLMAPRVRVNALTPGGVLRGQPEAFRKRYQERTPLGRMATEEDMKGAAAFLASDLSAYVTGHNLVVDGGWTAW